MWKDFKEFAFKGNVIDMAVGVIIGGAFGKIVTSLVNDIMMPILGYFTSSMDFKHLKIQLGAEETSAILYGSFIQNIVDFIIIALSVFFFIRIINKAKNRFEKNEETEEKVEEAKPSETELLLAEIRDILKQK